MPGGGFYESGGTEALRSRRARRVAYIAAVSAVMVATAAYSMTINASGITAAEVFRSFVDQLLPGTFDVPERTRMIVMRVYAPRVLMAVFVGGILAAGGCMVQTILKNPLATPYTLGISSSAAFGAGMSIILGVSAAAGTAGVMLNAFLFSMVPAAVILTATARRNISPTTLILIGVSTSYLFSAANTLMQYFGSADAVKDAMFWAVGDLNQALLSQVPYVLVTLVVTLLCAAWLLKDINALRMGDDTAAALGTDVRSVRTATILLACFSTSVAVSLVGAIGFVCLLAPHISRIFVGTDLKYLLPASAVTGSLLLVLADIVAKDLLNPVILPVGAITAVIGAPVLICMLLRGRDRSFR